MTASVPARASGVIYSCVNMAASVASQVAARRLRTAASKPALLDKLKNPHRSLIWSPSPLLTQRSKFTLKPHSSLLCPRSFCRRDLTPSLRHQPTSAAYVISLRHTYVTAYVSSPTSSAYVISLRHQPTSQPTSSAYVITYVTAYVISLRHQPTTYVISLRHQPTSSVISLRHRSYVISLRHQPTSSAYVISLRHQPTVVGYQRCN
uniref:Uncharacterized protein n=1 Tax=Knipowitschia caucasica TaxID=637954 RepID=A0AAV2M9K3_KNICA